MKRRHPPIIDGDIKSARWLVVGWILGQQTPDTQKPRYKLAKARQNTHMPTMAAAVVPRTPWCPPPGAAAYNNQPTCCATHLCLKTRDYLFIYYLVATKVMARCIVNAPCLCLLIAAAAGGRFWPAITSGDPSHYL